jgi:glycosyltransferase involved in cell wall biosynthesis
MNVPRLLLVTGTPPGPEGVGAIILKDLCRIYPKGMISCYAVLPPEFGFTFRDNSCLLAFKRGDRLYERLGPTRFGAVGKLLKWTIRRRQIRQHIRKLVDEAVVLGQANNVDAVWAVLDCPTSIRLALPVSRALKVPLFSHVWDDIHHNLNYFGVDRLSRKTIIQIYSDTLKSSSRCAVAGEAMRDRYHRDYGIDGVAIKHCLPKAVIQNVNSEACRRDDGTYVIGFAGSVTAPDAFNALMSSLSRAGWKVGGRRIILRVLGYRFDMKSSVPAQIEYYGWRSTEETIKVLFSCDICYLPQPFEQSMSPMAELSFPIKLVTYLGAGRPIFIHSRQGSSMARFFREYCVGTWCNTLDEQEIIDGLKTLLTDSVLYRKSIVNEMRAIQDHFTEERFRRSLSDFLGVEESHLRHFEDECT